jgi:hypothetical protein
MHPGPLDVIRGGLSEVWASKGRTFATFEVEGRSGPDADRWIQYVDGRLNVRWPISEAPAGALASRGIAPPAGAFSSFHVPGESAIFEVGDARLDEVASFIDALFANIVAERRDYHVASRVDLDR